MKTYLILLLSFTALFMACDKDGNLVNFEEDISGSWLFTFHDMIDDLDGTYSAGIGSEPGEDCCGTGAFNLQIDGVTNFYDTELVVSSNGSFTMDFLIDDVSKGNASGNLNADGEGDGTYSITWTNFSTGDTRVVSGNMTASK